MTRWWTDLLAAVSDIVPLPLVVLVLICVAAAVGMLWYFFPDWVPRRLPNWRLRWPRWRWQWRSLHWPRLAWPIWRWSSPWSRLWRWWQRWRRRTGDGGEAAAPVEVPVEAAPPDLPVAADLALADRFAAEGRYAEAVRERLRAIVADLVQQGIVEHRPGWTITELAGAAALTRPAVDPPLGEAARIFSDIWYGLRPARREHDARMRELTGEITYKTQAGGRS